MAILGINPFILPWVRPCKKSFSFDKAIKIIGNVRSSLFAKTYLAIILPTSEIYKDFKQLK